MNFKNRKNSKKSFFEFLSKDRFLGLDKNNFLWTGDEIQLLAVLKSLPLCESSEGLVNFISFWNNDFIFTDQKTKDFFENLKTIPYETLTVSTLFSYLKIKYHQNDKSLGYSEWSHVISILLNPKISNIVLDFLLEMEISTFLEITNSGSEFLKAIRLECQFLTIPNDYSWDMRGFYNLLIFLKVEKNLIKSLITKILNQKSFDPLRDFLQEYKIQFY